jgi:SAM-dependent methyltransferase
MPLTPDNPFTAMQKRVYAEEAAKWTPENRDPVVGAWDAHNAHADYDLLFDGLDTKRMVALDFGCGPGRMIVKYADRFRRIAGADLDYTNLLRAIEWCKLNGKENVAPVHLVNGVDLGSIQSGFFDLVYSAICLQHIPVHEIRLNLFREFRRVLKPGGWLTAQMGYGDGGDPRGVGYHEDRHDADCTNGGFDVKVTEIGQLEGDLAEAGFDPHQSRFVVRPAGPNDWHPNWIFFRARKPEAA